ncbi:MAG: hypothetical protein KAR06_00765, partial [Deltaproteobacteria bacterium]|nr:hypothetical protein [Deltaproteobacteria bacterium]
MDKELIKMCDCPEIQDRWEPKDGDRFYNTHFKGHWMLPDREACEGGDECECCNWEEHEVKESKYIIYIPRIEDVL